MYFSSLFIKAPHHQMSHYRHHQKNRRRHHHRHHHHHHRMHHHHHHRHFFVVVVEAIHCAILVFTAIGWRIFIHMLDKIYLSNLL